MFDAVAPAAPPENWLIAAICTMERLVSQTAQVQQTRRVRRTA